MPSLDEKREREKEKLRHRAEHHPPTTDAARMAHEKVRTWVYAFGALLIDTCPASTELADAVRTLTDDVAAGCHAAIARYPERLPALEPRDAAAEAAAEALDALPDAAARLGTDTPDALTQVDLDEMDPLPDVPGYAGSAPVQPAVPPAVPHAVKPAAPRPAGDGPQGS